MSQNNKEKHFHNWKNTKFAGMAWILAILVLVIAIVLNMIISRLDFSWDISPNKQYSLSSTTEKYLDQLDSAFQDFAALDFPTEFDYLESLADEASAYMTQAVESYHEAYSNGGYNQLTADYAKENYARANKRIQIIITFLHGEQPENVNLTTAEETADAASTTAE